MGMIQREIDKLRAELLARNPNDRGLYAAMAALEWALEPSGVQPPFDYLTGKAGAKAGCLPELHQRPSSSSEGPKQTRSAL